MITDPFFYLCAIPAVLLYGMAKGGFGGGVAVVAVPLMTLAVPPVQAAAILLPLLVAMDFVAIWSFRGSWSRQNVKLTLPGAIVGIILGAFTFRYLSDDAIRILIGLISVVFCLDYWFRPTPKQGRKPSAIRGTFWGTISGFTSFGIHQGGAPMSIYLLPQQMEKRMLMGTFAVFFTVVNLIKLVPYTWLGQFDHRNLMTSLVLLPLAPAGVRFGYYILGKVNDKTIYAICYFFLFIVGMKLLWTGVKGAFT